MTFQSPMLGAIPSKTNFIPEVSLEVKSLPSKALSYPPGSIIKYRPYSFGEIKKINQEKNSTKDTIEFALSGIQANFDVKKITISDLLFIGLLRKISTLGTTKVVIPYDCDKCKGKVREVVDTDKLEFDDIQAPSLPVVCDFGGKDFKFMPLTVEGYLELCDLGKQDEELSMMAKQVTNVAFDESYKTFYNATIEDGKFLDDIDKYLYHGIKPISSTCTQCKNKISIELDGGQALLVPFRGDQVPTKTRIRFSP